MSTQNKLTPGDDTLTQPEKLPEGKSATGRERPSVIGKLKAAQEKLAEKADTPKVPKKLTCPLIKKRTSVPELVQGFISFNVCCILPLFCQNGQCHVNFLDGYRITRPDISY